MAEETIISGIPSEGPLADIREDDATGEISPIVYGDGPNLHISYRIPIKSLHFNIENGRHATLNGLLQAANPGVNIDPREDKWKKEILSLLNGQWQDQGSTGANTKSEETFFNQLVEDIRARGQERSGVVIQNGSVMSGNRRLAALITLNQERPDVKDYQYFKAFIVPGHAGMTASDRWRLEITQQMGQGRLLRDYTPANRLLKIREGINTFMSERGVSLDEAINLVAFDFGAPNSDTIRNDYDSLTFIDEYLDAIDRPGEYWLINDKTEVFTEFLNLNEALKANNLSLEKRAELKLSLFQLIFIGEVSHQFMRKVSRAVGPRRVTRRSQPGVPEAVAILTNNAPKLEDVGKVLSDTEKRKVVDVGRDFESQVQAASQMETPITKSNRAAMELLAVAQSLAGGEIDEDRLDELTKNLNNAKRHLDACFEQLPTV